MKNLLAVLAIIVGSVIAIELLGYRAIPVVAWLIIAGIFYFVFRHETKGWHNGKK